jgi:hypothetical protein
MGGNPVGNRGGLCCEGRFEDFKGRKWVALATPTVENKAICLEGTVVVLVGEIEPISWVGREVIPEGSREESCEESTLG